MRVAIAAAGTGGHVYPALAVAEELVAGGVPRENVVFFGGDRLERTAVPRAGFPFVGFALGRLRRSLTPGNLAIPYLVVRSSSAMAAELVRRRVDALLGMSAYVTVPASLAARRRDVPFFLQEQNAAPGLAAKFASRRAQATFLGLPGRSEQLPRAEITGNPLRPALAAFDRGELRAAGRRKYGVGLDVTVLGVLGGSLGAQVLNEAVPRVIEAWSGAPLAVVHLTGRTAHAEMARRAEGAPLPWRCVAFEEEMEHFYAAADLVLCRAGAMTISELAATGTPAVVVPLDAVGQQWNARALADVGGAVVLPQSLAGEVPVVIRDLLLDAPQRAEMAEAARSLARPHAGRTIAERLIEVAGD